MTGVARRQAERFAAVAVMELEVDAAVAGIHGIAYPDGGDRPCLVKLSVDGTIHAIAIAGEFSKAAAAAGLRFGWCGFRLGSVPAGPATDVEIICAVSDRVLRRLEPDTIQRLQASEFRRRLSVVELTARAAELGNCNDLNQIYPLASDFRSRFGDRLFVTALYRYVLGRAPSASELNDFLATLPSGRAVEDMFNSFTSSEEFRRTRSFPLLGVFSPGFPFSTALSAAGHA